VCSFIIVLFSWLVIRGASRCHAIVTITHNNQWKTAKVQRHVAGQIMGGGSGICVSQNLHHAQLFIPWYELPTVRCPGRPTMTATIGKHAHNYVPVNTNKTCTRRTRTRSRIYRLSAPNIGTLAAWPRYRCPVTPSADGSTSRSRWNNEKHNVPH